MARKSTRIQRADEILDVAIHVIEDKGMDTFHLRDVAKEMRLTENAIRYYFKSTPDMIQALAARSDPRFLEERSEISRDLDTHEEKLATLISLGVPRGSEDTEWRVIWSAVLTAGFQLDKQQSIQGIFHRQVDLYKQVLQAGADSGAFKLTHEAHDIAITLMSLEDNLGYRIVAHDPQIARSDAIRIMRQYAELATGSTLPILD
ncbi:TetR family transcriptional regulator [Arthrobacter sp. MYb227]|uniref:TetR/AcrR family transcriptional regulator n=1 Tax=Arthrobacter sp. MYb227 TaxID=1848601 RepID=UPI000CFC3BA9|nr:TetR/AcrR family transcriptional regulator [Arthrobacter sp. MYb227]PQZ92876.1 TetR family transcriptional regulator [Arthrobacter sp. MYb227]